ncbi:MAG: hypothetical protein KC457_19080, partial [Myxococcales bacterium]|nr:hypothetical protein [Myxococcales bacterium]
MPVSTRSPLFVGLALLTLACAEKEIDTKAIDDPLNDPWVAGLGSDDDVAADAGLEEPAPADPAAGPAADPAAEVVAGETEGAVPGEGETGPAADPAAGEPASVAVGGTATNPSAPAGTPKVTAGTAPVGDTSGAGGDGDQGDG